MKANILVGRKFQPILFLLLIVCSKDFVSSSSLLHHPLSRSLSRYWSLWSWNLFWNEGLWLCWYHRRRERRLLLIYFILLLFDVWLFSSSQVSPSVPFVLQWKLKKGDKKNRSAVLMKAIFASCGKITGIPLLFFSSFIQAPSSPLMILSSSCLTSHFSLISEAVFNSKFSTEERREGGVWCFCLNLIITAQKREEREREEPLKLFFLFSPWTELTRQSKWLMQRRWWWSNTQNVSSFLSSSLSVYYFSIPFVCLFSVSPGPLMTDFSRLSASQTLDMDSVGSGTVPGISGGVGGGKSCKKKKKRRHRYLHIPYSFFL